MTPPDRVFVRADDVGRPIVLPRHAPTNVIRVAATDTAPVLMTGGRLNGLEADGDTIQASEDGAIGQVQRQHDGLEALDVLRVRQHARRCRLQSHQMKSELTIADVCEQPTLCSQLLSQRVWLWVRVDKRAQGRMPGLGRDVVCS